MKEVFFVAKRKDEANKIYQRLFVPSWLICAVICMKKSILYIGQFAFTRQKHIRSIYASIFLLLSVWNKHDQYGYQWSLIPVKTETWHLQHSGRTPSIFLGQRLRKTRDKTELRSQRGNKSGGLQWETASRCSNQRLWGGGKPSETFLQGDERETARELVPRMKEDEDKVKGNLYEVQRRESRRSWSQSLNPCASRSELLVVVLFRNRKCVDDLWFERLVVSFFIDFKMSLID